MFQFAYKYVFINHYNVNGCMMSHYYWHGIMSLNGSALSRKLGDKVANFDVLVE